MKQTTPTDIQEQTYEHTDNNVVAVKLFSSATVSCHFSV